MSKHTPGPWTVTKTGSFGWSIRGNWHSALENSSLAFVDAGICEIKGVFYDENAANGRLIGAAPELLETMDAMCAYVERFGEISEAPEDSDCWTVLERARGLRARIHGKGAPTPHEPLLTEAERAEVVRLCTDCLADTGSKRRARTMRAVLNKLEIGR